MAKLWAGRFQKETDLLVNDFNSSISFDSRFYKEDIQGSKAHAKMLVKSSIITEEEGKQILEGLDGILQDIENNIIEFSVEYEDIHMNIEKILTDRIGNNGKKLHTARSRNDQVAVDMRLYVKKEIIEIVNALVLFEQALLKKAESNLDTVMPGYTHLQRAQPITFAHHMMAYANMLKRDISRLTDCYQRMDECPLGAGALATTTYNIDREYSSELLGFSKPCDNSLDAVSDRDYCVELTSDISILMMHLSRLSEEIIMWCSWEFRFIQLDDAYSTGSSIMPQKKNPDICELIRGKTGRVYGSLISMLTMMKSLPLAYNKDMQEDKEMLFDCIDTVKLCLEVITPMFDTMTILSENMYNAASRGFINATDCADYLVKKGMAFRDAYMVTGKLVSHCIENQLTLETMSIDELKEFSDLFEEDVFVALDLLTCVNERKVTGGPASVEVKRQITKIRDYLEDLNLK